MFCVWFLGLVNGSGSLNRSPIARRIARALGRGYGWEGVVSDEATDEEGVIERSDKQVSHPAILRESKVEVRYVIKGAENFDGGVGYKAKISFSYLVVDMRKQQVLINGACPIMIEKGDLVLLYLKKTEGGNYINVLRGEYDNEFAVVHLEDRLGDAKPEDFKIGVPALNLNLSGRRINISNEGAKRFWS